MLTWRRIETRIEAKSSGKRGDGRQALVELIRRGRIRHS
jgi:hypothetical protein